MESFHGKISILNQIEYLEEQEPSMALKASDINRFAVTGALYLKVMTRKNP